MFLVNLARELTTLGYYFKIEISLESHSIEFGRYLDPKLGSRFSGVSRRNKLDGIDIVVASVEIVRNSGRNGVFDQVRIWTSRPPRGSLI